MSLIARTLPLLLIVLLAASSLIMVKPTFAQTIPKPSTPEFTLKFIKASNNVVDPNTGASQQVDNSSIDFIVKNQPFNYSFNNTTYHLYYKFQMKFTLLKETGLNKTPCFIYLIHHTIIILMIFPVLFMFGMTRHYQSNQTRIIQLNPTF